VDVGADQLGEPAQLVERELLEADAPLQRMAHHPADDLVRLAERQPLADQVVGEIRGGGEVLAGGRAHAVGAERERGQHGRQDAQDRQQRVGGIEERLLVLLHVGVVGERQPLHRGQDGDEVAVEPAALAAHELRHVRVLLLRHDRRAGRPGVGELHEPELRGRPEREIRGQPREVHAGDRRRREKLEHVVAVADRVQAVRGRRGEAEVASERLTVDRESGAGQRGGAEGHDVGAPRAVLEALAVALEHQHVRQ
jgi:hypothetical protein